MTMDNVGNVDSKFLFLAFILSEVCAQFALFCFFFLQQRDCDLMKPALMECCKPGGPSKELPISSTSPR